MGDPVAPAPDLSGTRGHLIEERLIDPTSRLPSCYELNLVSRADESARELIKSAFNETATRLDRHVARLPRSVARDAVVANSGGLTTLAHHRSRLYVFLAELIRRRSRFLCGLCMICLNWLSSHGESRSLIAEAMYGLGRSKMSGVEETPEGSTSGTLKALSSYELLTFRLTMILSESFRSLSAEYPQTGGSRAKWTRTMSVAGHVCKALSVLTAWRYMLGRSFHCDPVSHSLRHVVVRSSPPGVSSDQGTSMVSRGSRKSTWNQIPLLGAILAFSWATQLAAEVSSVQKKSQSSPPKPSHTIPTDRQGGSCPLCRRTAVYPTASTGGYVFCLSCIVPVSRRQGRCPVSGRPCKESQLVRIFESARGAME